MMRISDLEPYININTEVIVLDWDGDEVGRYDGKNSLDEIQDAIISLFWVAKDKLVIEVY